MQIGSKEGQDFFASSMIGRSGTFMDIGCNDPLLGNNTVWLERSGWSGFCFDIDRSKIEASRGKRGAISQVFDFTRNPLEMFKSLNVPKWSDYLSFDVDESTVEAVNNFPWDEYSFGVITIEHDGFRFDERRKVIQDVLIDKHGYRMFASNVEYSQNKPFEHWLFSPLIEPKIRLRTLGVCPSNKLWSSLCRDFVESECDVKEISVFS